MYVFIVHTTITSLSIGYQDIHENLNFIFFDISFDILGKNF